MVLGVDMVKLTDNNYVLLILICLLAGITLSGCYSSEIIKDYSIPVEDVKLITRIDFKDGKTLDFREFENTNRLISIDKEKVVYNNPAGNKYFLPANEIARFYKNNLTPWKTVVFILGTAAAAALLFLKF